MMKVLEWTLPLAVAGGIVSWFLQGRRRRWRSLFDEAPAGMTMEQYERRQHIHYQARRFLFSVLCAVLIVFLGFVLSVWRL